MNLMGARRNLNGLKSDIGPEERDGPAVNFRVPVMIIRLGNHCERRRSGLDLEVHGGNQKLWIQNIGRRLIRDRDK